MTTPFIHSLRFRLSVMVAAVIFAAVMATAGFSSWTSFSREVTSQRTLLQATASAYAASIGAPVARGDKASAARYLRGVRDVQGIEMAEVRTDAGVFVQFGGTAMLIGRDGEAGEMDTASLWRARQISTIVPIVEGGVEVGQLRLVRDISDLRAAVFANLRMTGAVSAIAILLGVGLAQLLIARMTLSLRRLTGQMAAFAEDQAAEIETINAGRGETGILAETFNTMIDAIRTRDAAIAHHMETLEDTVDARTQDLRLARDEAEAANAAKSDFLATMSHEIRTPMNGMLVMADMLSAADLSARHRRYADIIARSGKSLLTIINDILDLSKIESGKLDLEAAEVSPDTLIGDVASLFWERAREKGLDLSTFVAADLPTRFIGDPTRLNQIITNLVNNALKFTETGGVAVRLTSADASGETARLVLDVIDTGIGIPDDKIAHIFNAFSQADQTTTRRFGGTGLGLAVVKRLVDAMDGEITVTSREGRGSCFRVTWPAAIAAPATAFSADHLPVHLDLPPGLRRRALARALADHGADPAAPATRAAFVLTLSSRAEAGPGGPAPCVLLSDIGDTDAGRLLASGDAVDLLAEPYSRADLQGLLSRAMAGTWRGRDALDGAGPKAARAQFPGLRVLAADDNAVNREVLREALATLGIQADFAIDGLEAVEKAAGADYDIIFMDGSMPVMDGFEATRRIRASETGARASIVALTAQVAGSSEADWRAAGADGFITKPFTIDRLSDALAGLATPSADTQAAPRESTDVLDAEIVGAMDAMGAVPGAVRKKVWSLFRAKARDGLADLHKALASGSAGEDVARRAHALKSMALSAGAAALAEACEALEAAGHSGAPPPHLQAGLIEIGTCLAATLEAMDAYGETGGSHAAAG